MHKISRYIADFAHDNGVTVVIAGHNKLQKQKANLGNANNQTFVQLPFSSLLWMLRYKLNAYGIEFVCTEESYTSKADFKAMDEMPVYGKEKAAPQFSGKRIHRGLYRHYDGSMGNADLNGAANILRKVFPKVNRWDSGCMDHPKIITIS